MIIVISVFNKKAGSETNSCHKQKGQTFYLAGQT